MNATLRIGAAIAVTGSSELEGCLGTVIDLGGDLPDLPDMIRVRLPGQVPPVWWIHRDHLTQQPEPNS
jgi:hypothetical protein